MTVEMAQKAVTSVTHFCGLSAVMSLDHFSGLFIGPRTIFDHG